MISKKVILLEFIKSVKKLLIRELQTNVLLKKNTIIDCFGKERNMTYYAFGLYTNTSSR